MKGKKGEGLFGLTELKDMLLVLGVLLVLVFIIWLLVSRGGEPTLQKAVHTILGR